MAQTVTLDNIKYYCTTYDELIELILNSIAERKQTLITYINQYVFNYSVDNLSFKELLQNFDIVHPDGTGIYNALKFLYKFQTKIQRINGSDLYPKLIERISKTGHKIFYIGGIEQTKIVIDSNSEKFCSAGVISNSGFKKNTDIGKRLNLVSPEIVFVGLGTPYQEEIAVMLKQETKVPVIICCGSGIDIIAGSYKRPPVLIRNLHLEWLYKLIFDFNRTWKRYVIGIPVFIFKILYYKITSQSKKNSG